MYTIFIINRDYILLSTMRCQCQSLFHVNLISNQFLKRCSPGRCSSVQTNATSHTHPKQANTNIDLFGRPYKNKTHLMCCIAMLQHQPSRLLSEDNEFQAFVLEFQPSICTPSWILILIYLYHFKVIFTHVHERQLLKATIVKSYELIRGRSIHFCAPPA